MSSMSKSVSQGAVQPAAREFANGDWRRPCRVIEVDAEPRAIAQLKADAAADRPKPVVLGERRGRPRLVSQPLGRYHHLSVQYSREPLRERDAPAGRDVVRRVFEQ